MVKNYILLVIIMLLSVPCRTFAADAASKDGGTITIKKSYIYEAVVKMLQSHDAELEQIIEKNYSKSTSKTFKAAPKTWNEVIKSINSEGLTVDMVDWTQVNEMCDYFNQKHDEEDYNACRAKIGLVEGNNERDMQYCKDRTEREFPVTLLKKHRDIEKMTVLNDKNKIELKTISIGPFSQKELENRRSNYYESCMEQRGWRNPYDWRSGINIGDSR